MTIKKIKKNYWNIENFQLSVSSVICPTGISIIPLTRSMGRFERLQRLPSQMYERIKLISYFQKYKHDVEVCWIILSLPK